MNSIFNFSRFGKYFLYDLRNAKNSAGLSILVLGLLPIIIFVVFEICCLVLDGHLNESEDTGMIAISAAVMASTIIAPKKLYGGITDKKIGADYLLIPASCFEKFLSMLLILCVIIPLLLCVTLTLTDGLMCLVFPKYYLPINVSNDITGDVNLTPIVMGGWIGGILSFTLGALIFKKSKIAKTILASLVLSILMLPFIKITAENYINVPEFDAARFINASANIQIFGWNSLLMIAIYLRLRYIKL